MSRRRAKESGGWPKGAKVLILRVVTVAPAGSSDFKAGRAICWMHGSSLELFRAARSATPSAWVRTVVTSELTSVAPWSKSGEVMSTTSMRLGLWAPAHFARRVVIDRSLLVVVFGDCFQPGRSAAVRFTALAMARSAAGLTAVVEGDDTLAPVLPQHAVVAPRTPTVSPTMVLASLTHRLRSSNSRATPRPPARVDSHTMAGGGGAEGCPPAPLATLGTRHAAHGHHARR